MRSELLQNCVNIVLKHFVRRTFHDCSYELNLFPLKWRRSYHKPYCCLPPRKANKSKSDYWDNIQAGLNGYCNVKGTRSAQAGQGCRIDAVEILLPGKPGLPSLTNWICFLRRISSSGWRCCSLSTFPFFTSSARPPTHLVKASTNTMFEGYTHSLWISTKRIIIRTSGWCSLE